MCLIIDDSIYYLMQHQINCWFLDSPFIYHRLDISVVHKKKCPQKIKTLYLKWGQIWLTAWTKQTNEQGVRRCIDQSSISSSKSLPFKDATDTLYPDLTCQWIKYRYIMELSAVSAEFRVVKLKHSVI